MAERETTLVLGGSHGRGEPTGILLHERLERFPLSGLHSRIAHPELIKAGDERYLGTAKQIMAHYQVAFDALKRGDEKFLREDPDRYAAAENIRWFESHYALANPEIVVFDVHDTTVPGMNFCGIGPKASKKTIVAAYDLGHRRFIVFSDSPFVNVVSNAACLENSRADTSPEEIALSLYKGLRDLGDVDPDRYEKIEEELSFYWEREVSSYYDDGKIRRVRPGLRYLEERVDPQPAFSEIDFSRIPPDVRRDFGLPEKAISRTWGHENMSRQAPDVLGYTASGKPRREWIGAYYEPLASPNVQNEWVVFDTSKV